MEKVIQNKIKLLKKHRKGCYAITATKQGVWKSPWAFPSKDVWKSSRCDNRGNYVMWQVFICNDPECKAELAVENETLCIFIDKLLKKLPKGTECGRMRIRIPKVTQYHRLIRGDASWREK